MTCPSKRSSAAPLIVAIVLLLLPVLYVGSYLALVDPRGFYIPPSGLAVEFTHYRFGGDLADVFFWPLEQIDRRLRPVAWRSAWEDAPNQWGS